VRITSLIRATLLILLVFGLIVLVWAHWTPSIDSILTPLSVQRDDLFLKARAQLHTQPILVVLDMADTNVFARYVTEILKTEGIFSFESIDVSTDQLDSALLRQHRLVISAAPSRYRGILEQYVRQGGRLIVLNPGAAYDSLLGVRSSNEILESSYLRANPGNRVGAGISSVPMQCHGGISLLQPTHAVSVANIYFDDSTSTPYAAVGINRFGLGTSAFFSYDLGRSIVFTRQGHVRSRSADMDADGDGVFRTADLYFHTLDYSKLMIPQADEQQKLFIQLIYSLLDEETVLPRVWYFPDESPAIALVTGDSHGISSQSEIRHLTDYVHDRGGDYSLFEYPSALSPSFDSLLVAMGHSVEPHVYYPRIGNVFFMRIKLWIASWFSPSYFIRPGLSELEQEVRYASRSFHDKVGRAARVSRNHFLVWWGWSETAQLLAQYGFKMDLTVTGMDSRKLFAIPNGRSLRTPTGFGYINGSGQPMKYINDRGALIDIFEQLTQVEDDVIGGMYTTDPPNDSTTISTLTEKNRTLIDESVNKYHTALVWNFHPEHSVFRWPATVPLTWDWFAPTVDHLAQSKVPMISAEHWLDFVQARHNLSLQNVTYDPRTHKGSFVITSHNDVQGVTIMIPAVNGESPLGVTIASHRTGDQESSRPVISRRKLGGMTYDWFTLHLLRNTPVTVTYSR